MTLDFATATCRLQGCGGPASGVCINSLPFDECPDVVAQGEDGQAMPKAAAGPAIVTTGTSSALSVAEADAFLRTEGGILLALVAFPGAGKTTLSATMYDLACRGRLDGFGFAGSETVRAFEERCFLSRTASMAVAPDTARTPGSTEVGFLHLALVAQDGRRIELLLSDRSGEHFEEALDRPDEFAAFPELARADSVLLLVDAERLDAAHQAEVARVRRLVLAMDHARVLSGSMRLVVTKADRLTDDGRRVIVEDRATRLADEMARRLPNTKVALTFTECRARPGSSEIGHGLAALLASSVPEIATREFATTLWNPGSGGTALDRLMHSVKAS